MSVEALRARERAEISRSDVEAELIAEARLLADEANVSRYLDPPEDTPFPLEYAFHLLGDVRGGTVIDFGCGSGVNTLLVARRGARVIGVDVSESLLRVAARRMATNNLAATTTFVAGSAHEVPLRSASADVVLGIAILHHLDLDRVASETWRLLRAGGRAIFQEPIRSSALLRGLRRLIPYRAPDVSAYERPLVDAELARFASRFSHSRGRSFRLPFVSIAELMRLPLRRLRPLYQADAALIRTASWLTRYCSVRVLEVTK